MEDVAGVTIYNQKTREFEFRPGPIMANIVLADETDRTSPKTQSARRCRRAGTKATNGYC